MRRGQLTPEQEAAYRAELLGAVSAGYAALEEGGSALDAVTLVVARLEDCPLFNAGQGAVLNAAGTCELDAAVMDGADLRAGAVAGVRDARNPVRLARAVMEHSAHVFLVGPGAEEFARQQEKLELVENVHFVTEHRRREWEEARAALERGKPLDGLERVPAAPLPLGTVGAVALDRHRHLAAATSTGGMTLKRFGRVGDSALIGAGTYAEDATCAVSATGHGEFFIRAVAAHDVAARMRYGGRPLAQAAAEIIAAVGALGGAGGLIAVDREGNVALPFNSAGMYRAWRRLGDPAPGVAIFGDEPGPPDLAPH